MGTLLMQRPMIVRHVIPCWSPAQRILFRFAFAYLVLFNLFGGNSLLRLLWDGVVLWVGDVVFQVDITVRPLGSGDTTWNFVQVFCFLVIAAVATILWTALDRKRAHYERLHEWFRVFIRFALAMTMIMYGALKAIPVQMPSPSLERLLEPIGEASPMGILWTFMGASAGYVMFTGIAEMLGGLLLIARRTTLLGALICVGVLSNVVMLNFCYDVPVKLLSSHLLVMAVFLLLPDLRRLAGLFLFNRWVPPAAVRPLFARPWLNVTGLVLRTGFIVSITALSLFIGCFDLLTYGSLSPRSPLYGIWNVEEFKVDDQVQPRLITDKASWIHVIFDYPELLTIHKMGNSKEYFLLKLDTEKNTLELTKPKDAGWKSTITFQRPEPNLLVLAGTIDGQKIEVKLRLADESQVLLVSREFHWINETPFNR